MSDISPQNQIALAKVPSATETSLTDAEFRAGCKLKHWSQAIRDLYAEFLSLKAGVVPMKHASPTTQYGIGTTFKYGHLKLLDDLLYQFQKNSSNTYWERSSVPINSDYRWNAVTFHAGLFVAVGSNGRIVTSYDGITWDDHIQWVTVPQDGGVSSSVPAAAANEYLSDIEFFDVAWCGSMFVAVGSYNSFVYSYDGIYWHMPMFVGESYTSEEPTDGSGNTRYVKISPDDDLTNCPFASSDAWKGVAYDEHFGIIMLCGTQCRTMACRYSPTSFVARVVFEDTVFHIEDPASMMGHELRSIAAMLLTDKTSFVACGNYNQVVQVTLEHDTQMMHGQIIDDVEYIAPITVQKSTAGNPSASDAWNNIIVSKGKDGIERFVMLGTAGRSMASITGVANSWVVPIPEDPLITIELTCQASGGNLTVAAGKWSPSNDPNIVHYNDSVYTEANDVIYGETVSTVQHYTTFVEGASWNGAAFGNGVFVLAGDENRLYWQRIAEQDYSGTALSVDFYKKYLAELKERISEIENYVVRNDMKYVKLNNTTRVFSWNDTNAQMFQTSGNVVLYFNEPPLTIYKEMMIYLEAANNTTLSLGGKGEWENDFAEPEWGRPYSHLTLKAIFVGSRVIVQIIDNDQLADNLVDLIGG